MAKRMSLPQIRAYDKRRAARHEAGDVVYGHAKGLLVSACLYKNPDSPKTFAECQHQNYWLGRAFFCPYDFALLSKLQKAAFALAGAIAQQEADSAELVMDCWNDFGFSETDLCYVPADWEEKLSSEKFVVSAVNDAIAVLSSNNMLLKEITEILVREEEYNTHGLPLEVMEEVAVRLP